ncbi:TetR/AcrR family transcriptional regulator [Amycolatopsis anabasis]|uniref:TetR/AcrR family transcriptional regulator n=1 Tax=Amycolatopsis anabasis TaxID=1840409 RepID=UPI00131E2D87|nr:TetR/AcrR family transcriptional regulator [Amycolatopsis anabasis]
MSDLRSQHSRSGPGSGRERAIRAAYELFSREGTRAVGVDTVIARAGIAKMTLYRNFSSKDALILAVLERRAELWTRDWLRAGTERLAQRPAERLLAVFDLLGDWFASPDFEGCAFIRVLLESDAGSEVRQACVRHLGEIRLFLEELAAEAGVAEAGEVAHQWHLLMKGAIVAALEGDRRAAARARELGVLLLRAHGAEA